MMICSSPVKGIDVYIAGKSIEGPLKGKQRLRLPFDEGYWFEWVAFHPETKVY